MTEAQIIEAIRVGIRQPSEVDVSDVTLSEMIARSVSKIGLHMKEVDSTYFTKRVSLTSYTNIFTLPSDYETVLGVWDMGTTAKTITDATNASPIVITSADHGISDDSVVTVHDVGGNSAANDTWKVTAIDDDSFSLDGSVGDGDYTSGGKVFVETSNMEKIHRISPSSSTLDNDRRWFPRNKQIVIDDVSFSNDLVINYSATPSGVADIPESYHGLIVADCVLMSIVLPNSQSPNYADFVFSQNLYQNRWNTGLILMQGSLKTSGEARRIQDVLGLDL